MRPFGYCCGHNNTLLLLLLLQVIASISGVQQKLIEADVRLKPCCLEPITAHITIMVLHMPTQVLLHRCVSVQYIYLGKIYIWARYISVQDVYLCNIYKYC